MRNSYYTRERGLIARADGGIPSALTRALFAPPTMSTHIATILHRFALAYGRIQNRSGVTSPVGFAARAHTSIWKAGQVTAAGVFTDDTADAQSTTTGDFPLCDTGGGSGFLVACPQPINLISVLVSTAVAGSPTWVVEYSQAAGVWGTLTNLLSAVGFTSLAEDLIWWATPPDLAVMTAGHGTNVPVGYYGYRVRATVAPSTAPIATSLSLFEAVQCMEGLADNTNFEFAPAKSEHKFSVQADSLYAVVDDITALQSIALAEVRMY